MDGGTVAHTFSIDSTGPVDLSLSGSPRVSIGGTHTADFSVLNNPYSPVKTGNSAEFVIQFDPSAAGIRAATVSIANDDDDENPYDFAIQGTGTGSPEMDVRGKDISIANSDNIPTNTDDTDFGSAGIVTQTITTTFTISNTGAGGLNLDGAPKVKIVGLNADNFSVTAQPASSVVESSATTFEIVFNPSVLGTRSAVVVITGDDSDENPYTFAIQGTGTANPTALTLLSFAIRTPGQKWTALLVGLVWSVSAGIVGVGGWKILKRQQKG